MDTLLVVVAAIALAIMWLAVIRQHFRQFRESRTRKELEAEIRSLADDLATHPDGPSLSDIVAWLEIEMIREIVAELRKMPAGSRRLQSAIEITGDETYGRAA